MADTSKEKMGCFQRHVKGRWRKAPIGHAFSVLLAPPATATTCASSSLATANSDEGDDEPGKGEYECDEYGDQEATFSAGCLAESEPDSDGDFAQCRIDVEEGAQESLESECPHKRDRERHLYMNDEQIFASFSSKRKYEREWRHKKKKKGGKKHKKHDGKEERFSLCSRIMPSSHVFVLVLTDVTICWALITYRNL